MSDRLRLTTNTALDTLYSSIMFCRGVSSNIQTQLNNITSNNIFSGTFNMICRFYANVFFEANVTFNSLYIYFNGVAQFLNSVICDSNINVGGNINHTLESSNITFNQNAPSTEVNSRIFYNSTTGLNLENLNTTGGRNVRLNSGNDIRLQTVGNVILTRSNVSLSTVYSCDTLYQPGNLFLVNVPLPIPEYILTETYDDMQIRLPNAIVDDGINGGNGAHTFIRTSLDKSCTVSGSYTTGVNRIYNIANSNAVASVNCAANQNYSFFYYNGYWYTAD
jgi:hypothetical protein